MDIVWHFGPRGLDGECCHDLGMSEFIALDKASLTIGCSVQDVGNSLGYTKSGATRIVNRLEKKGYVERARSSKDGRICCVVITEKGKNILESGRSRYLELFEEMMSRIPGDPEKLVIETLNLMAMAARRT